MDADRRIIEIVEDDQGEGFEKALAKAIKECQA